MSHTIDALNNYLLPDSETIDSIFASENMETVDVGSNSLINDDGTLWEEQIIEHNRH
ncbi:MAG: hypothetical protein ACN2B6_10775 [Rickettsiales bacterium]